MRKVYKLYKERLVEISGRSRSLYSKRISKKSAYDIGKILDGDERAENEFISFLWSKKRQAFPLVNNTIKERIGRNLKVEKKDEAKTIISQVTHLKGLKREIEEFARETGRYELYIGYPFIEGSVGRETIVRAPLLLFPAVINVESETSVSIEIKTDENIQLNKVFILAYAQKYGIDIDEMETDFTSLQSAKLKSVEDVVKYMKGHGFKIKYQPRKGMLDFEKSKEPFLGDPIEVKHYAVIGRFPLANAIYNDYNLLEKRKPTQAILELLDSSSKFKKLKNTNPNQYIINSLDFAQEQAIEQLNQSGNMVIYGPPGTGKSQTIVNIITDAMCKGKRVLVVSQKRAALDVVYNRLGSLNNKVMYIVDPEKDKSGFYSRTVTTHQGLVGNNTMPNPLQKNVGTPTALVNLETRYKDVQDAIDEEVTALQAISDTLFTPGRLGLSMQQMYARSYQFGKDELERTMYARLINHTKLMNLNFAELDETIRVIQEKRKGELHYKQLEMLKRNPLIAHIKSDLSVHKIGSVKSFITKILNSNIVPFNFAKYPNGRQLLAFYLENNLSKPSELKPIVKFIAKIEKKKQSVVASNFTSAMSAIKVYVDEFTLLESVLDRKGLVLTLDNILNGNTLFLKLLFNALEDYVNVRDMNLNLKSITESDLLILNFAYKCANNLKNFQEVIDKIIPARLYHEICREEEKLKEKLSHIMDFENIKTRIISLKSEQQDIVKQICLEMFKSSYVSKYHTSSDNKNFLYQITKSQNMWPIRKLMEHYGDLMMEMFPCWLLSPENVSTIMPLTEGLFDLILFDEASQVFIESTLPTIYRGKFIAVAGDNKQLRPTALFMRRYMGNDIDDMDLDTQAALEVESLLDLATSRYNSINLNYHYRSKHEEFINFSNHAFYDCKLQIAPNLHKNLTKKPMERIVVDGRWIDRKNKQEAAEVVALLKRFLRNRKEKETIGIITFNAEQQQLIEDLIDDERKKDTAFGNAISAESNRRENGEDVSLFVKNIENVQGDERDVIIFSIGYARNEYGKVVSHFGPLNMEGGENRLNVAITRAKKKVFVITSIEPEELNVDNTKNVGPKLFRKYLEYVRAVSNGNQTEVGYILESLKMLPQVCEYELKKSIAPQIKEALEKLGWEVELNLGNVGYRFSLAIYDKKLDTYLLGVECDDTAYSSSSNLLERDVFRSKFMEGRGWNIIRVWSRDWWLSPTKVVSQLDKLATKRREQLLKAK